ncbi:MAG TPA: undecaprenyldiphospho-muramoylpentapeptide beta-N-acetylglucosaminyltransferase [Bacillota bacterium]|nr:undecaprenyldiphospho-muramoylpentapeptide beta-N-acetylglucosaminyltransferase [Bacillota bacterium]
MKVIMTGGGTGGHIYPAIAIADKIKEKSPSSEIMFIGVKRGKENELVPAAGYKIEFIKVHGLDRKNLFRNINVSREYLQARKDAGKIIKQFCPDAVIGTGGYVCAPALKAAHLQGIKTYIQEQNAMPGLANRMMEKHVEKVFLGFEEAGKGFKYPDKHIVTGNPVRKEFFSADKKEAKKEARKELGIKQKDFVLLAFGGSQGAGRINKSMISVIEKYNGRENMQIFFATGSYYHMPVMNELGEKGIRLKENVNVISYINDMHKYLNAADLVISRSGAITVSEIAVCGKPSILIPSPIVTGDHQTFNAKVLSEKGAAILMEEKNMREETLEQEIEKLIKDDEALSKMAKSAEKCAPVDAAEMICHYIADREQI